jgi:hypothetical protein
MFEFLKSDTFNTIGSLILGIGVIAVLKPICKGDDCIIQKAPSVDEVTKSTYQMSNKCYQFKTTPITCPDRGVIEPFYTM